MWCLFIWASLDIYCLCSQSNSSQSSKPGLTIDYLSHLQQGNCSEKKHFDLLSRGINERIFFWLETKPLLYTHIYLKAVPDLLHLSVKQQEIPTYNKKNIESAECVLGAKVSPADHPARRVDLSDEVKGLLLSGINVSAAPLWLFDCRKEKAARVSWRDPPECADLPEASFTVSRHNRLLLFRQIIAFLLSSVAVITSAPRCFTGSAENLQLDTK